MAGAGFPASVLYSQTLLFFQERHRKAIDESTMKNNQHPMQLVGSLVIDYFRWSQLAPMITIWFFAVLMVFLLYFVNHQDETVDGMAAVAGWVAELPVVGPPFIEWMEDRATDEGVLHFGGDDFKVAAVKAWALLSLVMMVIGWLARLLFGPFQPLTLKRKLGFAGLGSLALVAGFVGVYYLSPGLFNGTAVQWTLNFAGIAILVFLVSAWCLSIAHALGLLGRSVATLEIGKASPEDELKI